MEFRLLGPVEAWHEGTPVDLGRAQTGKSRCVLAVLLRTPGVVVPTEVLVERVWGDRPPGPAVRYKYIGWLRSALAAHGVGLVRSEQGYRLQVDADQVDLFRFRRLAVRAKSALTEGEVADAARWSGQALALWRGPALAGLRGAWADLLRDHLETERRDCVIVRARAALALGHHEDAAAMLSDGEIRYPTDEQIVALRMLTLYRRGRRAEALACYRRAEERVRTALGAAVGTELRTLYQRIQCRDPALPTAPDSRPTYPQVPVPPRQLPPAPRHFTARTTELGTLRGLLDRSSTMVAAAIHGTAGIGKTALALHLAHQVADRFHDGQLYVDLRGFDPAGAPMTVAEAVRGFLDALGVPVDRLPASLDAQIARYRSLLAGRRVLVVLDNARDADQVRPLLPGTPGCAAIVTSRDGLAPLVATEGAHPVPLDLLTDREAYDLLRQRLGPDRVRAEPDAVATIVTRCVGLPLALTVVAARAATQPRTPLAVPAQQLSRSTLDTLSAGDTRTDVQAVFSWSYRALTTPAARLFRLLGLQPGPDISLPAAASLAGLPRPPAERLLDDLVRASLVAEHTPGRYSQHDLLRTYAAEQADRTERADERADATRRVLDHYLHTAHAAARLLRPGAGPITLGAAHPGVTPEHLAGHEAALAWFTAEHRVLLAALAHAEHAGLDTHVWQLAWSLRDYLNSQGHWRTLGAVAAAALAAAERLGDIPVLALTHRMLAVATLQARDFDASHTHLRRALHLYQQTRDADGQAEAHLTVAHLRERQNDHGGGLHHAEHALNLYRATGDRHGQARALNAIGWFRAQLGDHKRALLPCRLAVAIQQELADPIGQAEAWDSLGYAYHHLGNHPRAIGCYQHAIDIYRHLSDPYHLADALTHLGDTYHAVGRGDAAHRVWREALTIFSGLGHPRADDLDGRLGPVDRSVDVPA